MVDVLQISGEFFSEDKPNKTEVSGLQQLISPFQAGSTGYSYIEDTSIFNYIYI
jgi:hypothetical protein